MSYGQLPTGDGDRRLRPVLDVPMRVEGAQPAVTLRVNDPRADDPDLARRQEPVPATSVPSIPCRLVEQRWVPRQHRVQRVSRRRDQERGVVDGEQRLDRQDQGLLMTALRARELNAAHAIGTVHVRVQAEAPCRCPCARPGHRRVGGYLDSTRIRGVLLKTLLRDDVTVRRRPPPGAARTTSTVGRQTFNVDVYSYGDPLRGRQRQTRT